MKTKTENFIKLLSTLMLLALLLFSFSSCSVLNLPDNEGENHKPVANAGDDQIVSFGDTVQLNGSGSSDEDGDTLSYNWSFTSTPDVSSATLSDPTIGNPTFTPDKSGQYIIQLIVNDAKEDSEPDNITIKVFETITISGKILNNGQPVVNKRLDFHYILGDWESEEIVSTIYTGGDGSFNFNIQYKNEYGSNCHFIIQHNGSDLGETFNNAFLDWHCGIEKIDSENIVIPDFDIKYDGQIISPSDNHTISSNDISDSTPLIFRWDHGARAGIINCVFQLRKEPNRYPSFTTPPIYNNEMLFNGMMDDGSHISAGTYKWKFWCHFSEEDRNFYAVPRRYTLIVN